MKSMFFRPWGVLVCVLLLSAACGSSSSDSPTEEEISIRATISACASMAIHTITVEDMCAASPVSDPELKTLNGAPHEGDEQRAIKLSWSVNQNGSHTFIVKRQIDGVMEEVATTSAYEYISTDPVHGYEDRLAPGQTYTYSVQLQNGNPKEVEPSTWVPFDGAPAAPSFDQSEMTTEAPVILTWNDNSSDDEQAFVIEKRDLTSGLFFTEVDRVSANTTEYFDTAVVNGHVYEYRVYAFHSDPAKRGSDNAVITVTVGSDEPQPPNWPGPLTIEEETPLQWRLRWKDSNEDSFELEKKEGTGDWVSLTLPDPHQLTYVDTDLQVDTEYLYRVRAEKEGLYSDWANASDTTDTNTLEILILDDPLVLGECVIGTSGHEGDVSITNTGTAPLDWIVTESPSWLTLATVPQSIAPNTPTAIDLTYDCLFATEGWHTASLTLADVSETTSDTVEVKVLVLSPELTLSPNNITLDCSSNQFEVSVLNTGSSGVLHWQLSTPPDFITAVPKDEGFVNAGSLEILYFDYTCDGQSTQTASLEFCGQEGVGCKSVTLNLDTSGVGPEAPVLDAFEIYDRERCHYSQGGTCLEWEDRSSDETHFNIYRRPLGSSDPFALILVRPPNFTFYNDESVGSYVGEYFEYQVEACNANGCSASNADSAMSDMEMGISYGFGPFDLINPQHDASPGSSTVTFTWNQPGFFSDDGYNIIYGYRIFLRNENFELSSEFELTYVEHPTASAIVNVPSGTYWWYVRAYGWLGYTGESTQIWRITVP